MSIAADNNVVQGIQTAMGKAILEATTPGPLLLQLLDGTEKVLVIEWNGSLHDPVGSGFNAFRGDGKVTLTRPGHRSYQMPPSVDTDDAAWNIRAGVPLWILNICPPRPPVVLGIGVLHPVHNSATCVFYDPTSKEAVLRVYFGDPRYPINKPRPQELLSYEEQREQIEAAGGALEPTPMLRPVFTKPWP
jgi:hypothetical protein